MLSNLLLPSSGTVNRSEKIDENTTEFRFGSIVIELPRLVFDYFFTDLLQRADDRFANVSNTITISE